MRVRIWCDPETADFLWQEVDADTPIEWEIGTSATGIMNPPAIREVPEELLTRYEAARVAAVRVHHEVARYATHDPEDAPGYVAPVETGAPEP